MSPRKMRLITLLASTPSRLVQASALRKAASSRLSWIGLYDALVPVEVTDRADGLAGTAWEFVKLGLSEQYCMGNISGWILI